MDLKRSCREVTRLVLESEDRDLTTTETLALQMHWRICDALPQVPRAGAVDA